MNRVRDYIMLRLFAGRMDSLLHFLVSALLALTAFPVIGWYAFPVVLLIGLAKELQELRKRGWFSWRDMAYNAAGLIYALVVANFL